MLKKDFPTIHFYDQDFVDLYERSWAWLEDIRQKNGESSKSLPRLSPAVDNKDTLNQIDACFASFFLVYSNKNYPVAPILDAFYSRQEADGAIRSDYAYKTGKPVFHKDNPLGVHPPLFSWAEFNLYHKVGVKKRIREIMPALERYFDWLDENFKQKNGLYSVPLVATGMANSPRTGMCYPVDFNAQQALNALYMSALGEVLNDKEKSYKYKKYYFSLKTRMNSMMWDEKDGYYYDLDRQEKRIHVKTVASFWPLLAEIPNEEKADRLIAELRNSKTFGIENPFPSLSAADENFDERGMGYKGSVFPHLTFMVIKGLEKYERYDLARECAIRHLYSILDTLNPTEEGKGNVWEAYKPRSEGAASWPGHHNFPRPLHMPFVGLSTIALMIENVVGLYISLPRKTVDWIVPTLEIMGIENLSLKRNMISILSNKSGRGWEIRLESEKLYYFTINIIGKKNKTLPIPSGKCSMLIDKL